MAFLKVFKIVKLNLHFFKRNQYDFSYFLFQFIINDIKIMAVMFHLDFHLALLAIHFTKSACLQA